jgi:GTPase SAR1 family protein
VGQHLLYVVIFGPAESLGLSQPFSPNNVEVYYDDDTMLLVANKIDEYTDHQPSWKESLQASSDAYNSRFVRKYAWYKGTNDIVFMSDDLPKVMRTLKSQEQDQRSL